MEPSPGGALGAYRLVEQIGTGGMAEVWRAYQPSLERYVAIKILPRRYADQPGYLERFRREALAISRLEHPNILQVHDFGEQDGFTYMVTPLVRGGTLAQRLGRPWSLAEVLHVIEPLASALDYAHGQGIIHRDVKPSNVLLTEHGRAILGDFGVARVLEAVTELTQVGALIGTPTYMGPEQSAGQPAEPASDLYSLGVIAYELLTGRPPFEAETPMAVALAHLHKPLPPPKTINPALPEAVEGALFKALAKSPRDRFSSGAAFVKALASIQPAGSTDNTTLQLASGQEAERPRTGSQADASRPSAPVTTSADRRAAVTAAVAVGLLVVASGIFMLIHGYPGGQEQQAPTTVPQLAAANVTPSAADESVSSPADTPGSGSTTIAQPPLRPLESPAASPEVRPARPESPGSLLRSDDFSDPAKGLFLNNQRGTGKPVFSNGRSADYQWEQSYVGGTLVIRIKGPYPENPDSRYLSVNTTASDKMIEDKFAVEIRGKATKSPDQAQYGITLGLSADPNDYAGFLIQPGASSYFLGIPGQKDTGVRTLAFSRSRTIKTGGQENILRMEVSGTIMRGFLNGQEVDRVQNEILSRRPLNIKLRASMTGPPTEGDVEVTYTDFKEYLLTP